MVFVRILFLPQGINELIVAYIANNYFIYFMVTVLYNGLNSYCIVFISNYFGEMDYYLSMSLWFSKSRKEKILTI